MRTRAAVLRQRIERPDYADRQPLEVATVHLEPPGAGEVLVRIEAAGLCHSDLSVINGDRPRPTPMVLGHEACGVVVGTGPGVDDLDVGQRVVCVFVPRCGTCDMCVAGRPALCPRAGTTNAAGEMPGGGFRWRFENGTPIYHHLGISAFAEHAVIDRRSLVPIPDDIPPLTAALFGCAVITGAGAVLNTADVRPGESVAVFGLGGVGLSAVLGAVVAGAAPIIAIDPVPAKRELALRLGATHAYAPDTAVSGIREITGRGVQHSVEAVGSARVLMDAWEATRPGGNTVSVGLANPRQTLEIPASVLVAEGRRLLGSYLGDCIPERDVPRFIQLWQDGRMPIDRLHSATIPLSRINEAVKSLAEGTAVRQMIVPDQAPRADAPASVA